jgi:hypothetical protein
MRGKIGYGPAIWYTWENMPQAKPHPSNYRAGEDFAAWGIPVNGTGRNNDGTVEPCVILFANSPQFLELELTSATGSQTNLHDAEHIRAKVGLEFLKRESVEPTSDRWRVCVSGRRGRAIIAASSRCSLPTVSKERLADSQTPWLLRQVSWRLPEQKPANPP